MGSFRFVLHLDFIPFCRLKHSDWNGTAAAAIALAIKTGSNCKHIYIQNEKKIKLKLYCSYHQHEFGFLSSELFLLLFFFTFFFSCFFSSIITIHARCFGSHIIGYFFFSFFFCGKLSVFFFFFCCHFPMYLTSFNSIEWRTEKWKLNSEFEKKRKVSALNRGNQRLFMQI